jgi:L-ascorbate metabolism protein UlaG (beta-lactamase superfamily)
MFITSAELPNERHSDLIMHRCTRPKPQRLGFPMEATLARLHRSACPYDSDSLDGLRKSATAAGHMAPGRRSSLFHTARCTGRAVTGSLTWWGHSTSTWQDRGTTVLFDPVLTAHLGHLRRIRGSVPPQQAAQADIVLISHLHADHTHLPSLRLVPASTVLIAPAGSRRLLKPITDRGVTLREVEPADVVEVSGLKIRVLAADHDGRRLLGSPHRAPAVGYLAEGSRRCWYPGDTGPRLALDELARLDIALLPVGGWGPSLGRGHLNAEQAAHIVRRTRPVHAVPVHWGTWWPIGLPQRLDLIDLPAAAFAYHVARLAPTTEVHLLTHGQSITV